VSGTFRIIFVVVVGVELGCAAALGSFRFRSSGNGLLVVDVSLLVAVVVAVVVVFITVHIFDVLRPML
jgi:hypothetical protein